MLKGDTDIAYMREVRTISPATMYWGSSRYMHEPGWICIHSVVRLRKVSRPSCTQTNWIMPEAMQHR